MNEWEVFQWKFVLLSEYRDEKTFEVWSRNSDMKIYSPDLEEKLPIPIMAGSSWSRRVPSWKILVQIEKDGNENTQSKEAEMPQIPLCNKEKNIAFIAPDSEGTNVF